MMVQVKEQMPRLYSSALTERAFPSLQTHDEVLPQALITSQVSPMMHSKVYVCTQFDKLWRLVSMRRRLISVMHRMIVSIPSPRSTGGQGEAVEMDVIRLRLGQGVPSLAQGTVSVEQSSCGAHLLPTTACQNSRAW